MWRDAVQEIEPVVKLFLDENKRRMAKSVENTGEHIAKATLKYIKKMPNKLSESFDFLKTLGKRSHTEGGDDEVSTTRDGGEDIEKRKDGDKKGGNLKSIKVKKPSLKKRKGFSNFDYLNYLEQLHDPIVQGGLYWRRYIIPVQSGQHLLLLYRLYYT